jgi:amino-acid N-acetyltransferase
MLENDIDRFTVIERDGMVIGCAALYPVPAEKVAEIACVAVHPTYRGSGRGDLLLSFLERRCRELGLSRLFVLTTQSAHFFRERGFEHAAVRDLPAGRRKAYSRKRRSKVLIKSL